MTQTIRVFVFGTLRVRSSRWAEQAEVADPIENCTTTGTMYNYGNAYPYVDFDGDGKIVGDVLTFDAEHPAYLRMRSVEIGAGYVERGVDVSMPGGFVARIIAWDASPRTKEELLPTLRAITTGDWLDIEARMAALH
jgi:gamma-glutamylcyclotransferase (GGCT)/AIG2-like uncharacterized protein YtfP